MSYSYYLVVGEFKISITIRSAGKQYKTLSGKELIRKVTSRAIERFLCEVFNVPYSNFNSKEIEYQPVFFRTSKKNKTIKVVRVRRQDVCMFKPITVDQMNNIGVTEDQFLKYLKENSIRIHPASGNISSSL